MNTLWSVVTSAASGVLATVFLSCSRRGRRIVGHWCRYPKRYLRRRRQEQLRQLAEQAQPGAECQGWLTDPVDKDTVGAEVTISGRVVGKPQDKDLWIVHRTVAPGEVWPKRRITADPDGWFTASTVEGGAFGSLAVALLLTPHAVSHDFEAWADRGRRTGRFPGFVLPASARELAHAVVRIDRDR
ncbi:hypothetical protein OH768_06140 [Streptomyces sp. NBC_01622]|uniref:hypothetical protein n=1 Tax=Streptomyces sp. NBC_01622 TaxID=2975903 RepID=UPI003869401E|nr:hypothetical protein OH768_06140 [Streptomyces sp. NBC_01622]